MEMTQNQLYGVRSTEDNITIEANVVYEAAKDKSLGNNRASKHMRICILICDNQHQYAKNLKNLQNNDFVY